MSEFDPEEMGTGMSAVVLLIAGFVALFFGVVSTLVFWPVGALVMALGGLLVVAALVVGALSLVENE
jgi:hypothetical protein